MNFLSMVSTLCFILGIIILNGEAAHNCLGEITHNAKESRNSLYRGEQEFTLALMSAIQRVTPNENIFFSPYSIYNALLLAYFGAKSVSEMELKKSLHLEWAEDKGAVYQAYKHEKNRESMFKSDSSVKFASVNRIFFDERLRIASCLRDILSDELSSKDFRENAEESRIDINTWIANVTENQIVDMLTPADISTETDLVLANAAYFKGDWANKFDPKDTRQEVFYTSKSKTSFVPMMHKRGTYDLTIDDNLGAYILRMPYLYKDEEEVENNEGTSMIIILPLFEENGVEKVVEKLKPDTLDKALKESVAREIDVSLPKFEFEQRLELLPVLRTLGVNSIFDSGADLSDFTADKNINFGDAKHVAKIRVDEEGSTAAAATVLFSFRSARPIEPTKFQCNHPFIFLVYDNNAKAILFSGIYRDPMTRKLN